MKLAPEPILHAVLYTVHRATVSCRNWSLSDDISREQINELMEAVHELPQIVRNWDSSSLDEIMTHLRCFEPAKWRARIDTELHSVPDVAEIFQQQMGEYESEKG